MADGRGPNGVGNNAYRRPTPISIVPSGKRWSSKYDIWVPIDSRYSDARKMWVPIENIPGYEYNTISESYVPLPNVLPPRYLRQSRKNRRNRKNRKNRKSRKSRKY